MADQRVSNMFVPHTMKSLLHKAPRVSSDTTRVDTMRVDTTRVDTTRVDTTCVPPENAALPPGLEAPPARRFAKAVADPLARYMNTLKPLVINEIQEIIAAAIQPQLDEQARLIDQLLQDVDALKQAASADTQHMFVIPHACGVAGFDDGVDETTDDGQLCEEQDSACDPIANDPKDIANLEDVGSPKDIFLGNPEDFANLEDTIANPEDFANNLGIGNDIADPEDIIADAEDDDEHFADASGETAEEPFIITSNGHRIAKLSDVDEDTLDQCRLDDMYKICELFSLAVPAKAKKTKLRSIILHAL